MVLMNNIVFSFCPYEFFSADQAIALSLLSMSTRITESALRSRVLPLLLSYLLCTHTSISKRAQRQLFRCAQVSLGTRKHEPKKTASPETRNEQQIRNALRSPEVFSVGARNAGTIISLLTRRFNDLSKWMS
jgi:hypothetical protein